MPANAIRIPSEIADITGDSLGLSIEGFRQEGEEAAEFGGFALEWAELGPRGPGLEVDPEVPPVRKMELDPPGGEGGAELGLGGL